MRIPSHSFVTMSKSLLDVIALPPFEDIIDVNQPSLYISLAAIAFNPLFWNIVARNGELIDNLDHVSGLSTKMGTQHSCYMM